MIIFSWVCLLGFVMSITIFSAYKIGEVMSHNAITNEINDMLEDEQKLNVSLDPYLEYAEAEIEVLLS